VLSVDDDVAGAASWGDVLAEADQNFDLETAAAAVNLGDVATLISRRHDGPPKAVELTHANLLAMVRALPGRSESTGPTSASCHTAGWHTSRSV